MDSEFRVGVDFDNTIVDYNPLFVEAGAASGFASLAEGGPKTALREYMRTHHGEDAWQRLQAEMYGPWLKRALPFVGFSNFLERARERSIPVYIVSHKSVYAAADPGGVNLHEAARAWLRDHRIEVDGVYFETSRSSKLRRIAQLRCTHFIDDLAEVLDDPQFPAGVSRILFSPGGSAAETSYPVYQSWFRLADEFATSAA